MICPYDRKALKYVKEYVNNLVNEEAGIIGSNKETYTEVYELMQCAKEDCGGTIIDAIIIKAQMDNKKSIE